MSETKGDRRENEHDTEAGLELLARAVEFLTICRSSPERAMEKEDPELLVEGLRSLLSSLGGAPGPRPMEEEDAQEGKEPEGHEPPMAA